LLRDIRKPLILMTPKSLLRHKRAVSKLDEFAIGASFHRILSDDAEKAQEGTLTLVEDAKIRRVVLCSGKVYYDLFEEREKRGINDIYLLRVEQLYPFPLKALISALARFKAADVFWCQEEPKNMGAWSFVDPYLEWVLAQAGGKSKRPLYAGRPAAASPATGMLSKHVAQMLAFMDDVFAA
jgi:2-oxoglutarate dehydrogenase E1 component